MIRCKTFTLGFCLLLIHSTFGLFEGNPYLNGFKNEYAYAYDQEPIASERVSIAARPFEQHSIYNRAVSGYAAPQYLPPVERQPLYCSGAEVCVQRNQCNNGYYTQGAPGSRQNCDSDTEVCCTYRPPPPPPTTSVPSTSCPASGYACVAPNVCNNGVVSPNALTNPVSGGSCYAPEVCCRVPPPESTSLTNDGYVVRVPQNPLPVPNPTPRPIPPPPRPQTPPPRPQTPPPRPQTPPPRPPTPPRPQTPPQRPPPPPRPQTPPPRPPPPPRPTVGQSYLPPITQRPQQPYQPQPQPPRPRPPPIRGEDQLSEPIFPPRGENSLGEPEFPTSCAAALNCTDIQFCDATGVISKTPVFLTPDQELFRVPLSDCQDTTKGIIGKCCRDPDYVDPWPVSQLGQYNAELFGDTGAYNPNPGNRLTRRVGSSRPSSQIASSFSITSGGFLTQNRPARLAKPDELIASPTFAEASYQQNSLPQSQYYKPVQSQCSTRNYNSQLRGPGPYDAAFSEYPWQAMILKESTKSLLCGGTIISDDMVATTAQCVQGQQSFDVLVKGGEWKLGRDEEPLKFQLIRVRKIDIHPNYDSNTLDNNFAILHLDTKFQFDQHIGQLCVDSNDPNPEDECVTTGWGKQAIRVHLQDAIMHHSSLSIVQCYEPSPSTVCGVPSIDACGLDVGSALACRNKQGQYYLKGVYSKESSCGNSVISFTKPDLQWINANKNRKGYAPTADY